MQIFVQVKQWAAFVCLLASATLPTHANAGVIFSNIDQPYPTFEGTNVKAMEFVPTQSGTLESIGLVLGVRPDLGPQSATVQLYTGLFTGLLETWAVTASFKIGSPGTVPLTTVVSLTSPYLTAGTSYWVFLINSNYNNVTNPGLGWGYDDTPSGPLFSNFSSDGVTAPGHPRNEQYGLEVKASIPEPITLSVFGVGLTGALAMRRRRRKVDAVRS